MSQGTPGVRHGRLSLSSLRYVSVGIAKDVREGMFLLRPSGNLGTGTAKSADTQGGLSTTGGQVLGN